MSHPAAPPPAASPWTEFERRLTLSQQADAEPPAVEPSAARSGSDTPQHDGADALLDGWQDDLGEVDPVEEYAASLAARAVAEAVALTVAAERERCAQLLRERAALESQVAQVEDLRSAGRLAAAVPPGAPGSAQERCRSGVASGGCGQDGVPGEEHDARLAPPVRLLAADLRVLSHTVVAQAQAFTAQAQVLARLAGRVERTERDSRGSTPWTRLVREVAVALRISDQASASSLEQSLLLMQRMPETLSALRQGRLPVAQASELLSTAHGCTDPRFVADSLDAGAAAVAAVDALAAKAARFRSWSVGRVRKEAQAAVLRADADAVAARTARRVAAREVRLRTRTQRGADTSPADTAELVLDGPALVLQQATQALDADARALQAWLRSQGDRRGLDALRFDLAVHRLLGQRAPVVPAPRTDDSEPAGPPTGEAWEAFQQAVGGDRLPDPTSATWWIDRRHTRPVQLQPLVPVTTLLGLSQEPGWVPGVGWVSAPTVRQLLPVSELRQVCVDTAGQVVDLAERALRPPPTARAARQALVGMCTEPFAITGSAWQREEHYRPSAALEELVRLRDGVDDGPTGSGVGGWTRTAPGQHGGELDHDEPYDPDRPDRGGPTAAFNLRLRGRRTHQLKHDGWTCVRTAAGTTWTSPAGQVVITPPWRFPLEPLLDGARLPDADGIHALEAELLRPPDEDDVPPF